MNRNSIIDYCGYTLLKIFGPLVRTLPIGVSLFLGRRLGDLFYYFDPKHKAIAYTNIKTVFEAKLSPQELSNITKKFYRNLGQSIMEIFLIPLVNKDYIKKYINIEGLEYIDTGFKHGKGVILLVVHAGSWELSNIICANLGFPFALLVREQRYPHLDNLLNSYRRLKGCRIIERQNQTRRIIEALKDNQAIGMTADQGGRGGVLVKFLGKEASMAGGAVRLALKYDAVIIPCYFTRISGPYIKIMIEPPFRLKRTANLEKDIQDNLQELVLIFQRYILKYPQDYLWTYKIWKYGLNTQHILLLGDGKTGHLRQAQAVASIAAEVFKEKSLDTKVDNIEVKFKNAWSKSALLISSSLAGRYHCQGCLWCLHRFLTRESYHSLVSIVPDVIISCGSSLAAINYVLSRENLSKSLVLMRPSILSVRRFDLVIIPRHDRPGQRRNIVVTEGALNLIDEDYLKEQSKNLVTSYQLPVTSYYISILIGGDTKIFHLEKNMVLEVIRQVKFISEKLDAYILVTTSRRTSSEIEELVKAQFKDYPGCKLLIIANEKNIPEAVGGILGLSKLVVVSPESISMISESASSNRYIIVYKAKVNPKHSRFLQYMAEKKYIYLCAPEEIASVMENLFRLTPHINVLRDRESVRQALERIF